MIEKVFPKNVFKGFDTTEKLRPSTAIEDIELVKRDLLNHFLTRRGERVMRPEYGSIIWDLLFEPFTEMLRDAVVSDVERIVNLDPRVAVEQIEVLEFEHGLRINVALLFQPFDAVSTFEVDFDRRNNINALSNFADSLE